MAENRQIQLRRDSVADWYSNNPTLASGEPGVETDTHRLRIGDGSTATTSLAVHQPIRTYAASADLTLADSDDYTHIFVITGATDRTITLPTAADNANRQYVIKKVDSGAGTVTIDGEGAETIDGESTKLLTTQYSWMTIVCDGSEWHVVDYYHAPHDTGWTSNSDWTNAEFTVTHNFDIALINLNVKFFLSSDGTDGNAIEVINTTAGSDSRGQALYQTGTNTFKIQTGKEGVQFIVDADGGATSLGGSDSYYYRVVVYKQQP